MSLHRTAEAYPPIILRALLPLAADLNPASRLDRGLTSNVDKLKNRRSVGPSQPRA